MKIPEVRERILKLAGEIEQAQPAQVGRRPWMLQEWSNYLKHLEEELHRRPQAKTKNKVVSQPMSTELMHDIVRYHNDHPGTTQLEIAHHFGISSGRVSEVLRGKRT